MSVFNTSETEAEKLTQALIHARNSAVSSNQVVYFELNIDKNSYEAYRIDRSAEPDDESFFKNPDKKEIKKNYVLSEYKMGTFQSILKLQLGSGRIQETGSITVKFSPYGYAEDFAVFIGSSGNVNKTVHYKKYLGRAVILPDEQILTLEKPEWKEDLSQ
jgi:hypothetical protein